MLTSIMTVMVSLVRLAYVVQVAFIYSQVSCTRTKIGIRMQVITTRKV